MIPWLILILRWKYPVKRSVVKLMTIAGWKRNPQKTTAVPPDATAIAAIMFML